MELTPNDVEQKAFTQALRGYQMDEVDDFLDEIVSTLRAYDQRLRDAQEKIRALESESASRGGDETTISRAILVAQRSADALLTDARGEADRIRQTAVAETESLSAERDKERTRLLDEITGMRDRVLGLRATLTTLVSTVGGQVSEMESALTETETGLGSNPVTKSEAPTAEITPIRGDMASIFPADVETAEVERIPQPASIDLNDVADESEPADVSKEEVGSRVSARPWERG
jgi:cell division initiation protein